MPLLRGVIVLAETLTLGMKALTYSANVAAEAEGMEIGKGAIALMMATSLAFGVGVFFLLPVFASTPLEGLFGRDLISNIAEGAIRLSLFVGYVYLIGRMRETELLQAEEGKKFPEENWNHNLKVIEKFRKRPKFSRNDGNGSK